MNEDNVETVLDAKGLSCPLPLLKMKLALKQLQKGQRVKVWSTDEGSIRDFQSFCDLSEHELLSMTRTEEFIEFLIQKG